MTHLALTRPADSLKRLKSRFESSVFLQVLVLLLLCYVSYPMWFIAPFERSFSQPSIALAVLGYSKVLLASFLVAFLCLVANHANVRRNILYRRLSWQAIKDNGEIDVRYFVLVVALVIAWAFSSYEYNFLYDQAHLFDRLLLIALGLLILANPYFIVPFTVFALVMVSQFKDSGLGNYAWIDKGPVFDLLILSSVFVLLRLFVRVRPTSFLFLALCLQASFYFIPGWAKVRLGPQPWNWVLGNHLHNIFVASYVNGWLGFLNQSTIMQMARIMAPLDIPFQIYTIVFELGGLFVFARKRLVPALLAGWILLHLGIFFSSGIFFWKWIAVDAAFLALLWHNWRNEELNSLFQSRYFAVSLIIIALSPMYFSPSWLAWFDTRLNTVYDLEVIDAGGNTYRVDRGFAAPYDVIFSQNRFYYLSRDYLLTITYGAVLDYDLARAIENAGAAMPSKHSERGMGAHPTMRMLPRALTASSRPTSTTSTSTRTGGRYRCCPSRRITSTAFHQHLWATSSFLSRQYVCALWKRTTMVMTY